MQDDISVERFHAMAQSAFDGLPSAFRRLCSNVVIHTADQAAPEILSEFGMSDPLDLSGLYEGVAITQASVTEPAAMPAHVHLYRHSILAEWRERSDISLSALITHVLVHEIGHHFGLCDEGMHRIEQNASDDEGS